MVRKNQVVQEWMFHIMDGMDWYPGKKYTPAEEVLCYIEDLEKKLAELEKFKTDEMWRRDQASVHRMGL